MKLFNLFRKSKNYEVLGISEEQSTDELFNDMFENISSMQNGVNEMIKLNQKSIKLCDEMLEILNRDSEIN